MKKVSIVGLGWLGMPLALALNGHGYHVTGTKTTQDGVEAARMSGIECYQLALTPELECDADELSALLQVDVLIVTLPASRTAEGGEGYAQAVQQLVNMARVFHVPRIIFTSSTSVYGDSSGTARENSPLQPTTVAGKTLVSLEQWLQHLPDTSVDILRLAGLVGGERHPGRFLAGKTNLPRGNHGVNLVHQEDVLAAILLLLKLPNGGHIYNLCAPEHPARQDFYPEQARRLHLSPPQFAPVTDSDQGKIVDGQRICHELGFEYQYPNPSTMPLNEGLSR
ncbi:SDR family oxidoreductase [Pectobacterium brasiliense]|uniref:SDR family oxidoreductase n=2 Tax=Pectobacterium TaxID=122277 RepID=A0AAE3BEJ0_9GAMM|nr:SDR family oxidoreductase [Pectobacterium brasiliense]MBA0218739.1 SDR family oxidoreductase [Pectobacterium brasiliense]MBN3051561.1 SDR family oxidoreductase [Pectobacterium brasiliense]MBN3073449.1 SDR family oxidoreductase [Pectobacterium brasiliense]MBN3169019.1 SDR family oxidoreductase [Pectobacterium brasiliense]